MANAGSNEQANKLFTLEGMKKMEEELEYLKTVKRVEVAERIKVARSFGDLSENAEYDAAKNEQAFMEGRIMELENTLRSAQVVSEDEIDHNSVTVGSIVTLHDTDKNRDVEYTIVGSSEADPLSRKVSNESPIGMALFGRNVGDTVKIIVPAGTLNLTIVSVRR